MIVANRYTTSNAVHQASKLPPEERKAFLDWLFDLEYRPAGPAEAGSGALSGYAHGAHGADDASAGDMPPAPMRTSTSRTRPICAAAGRTPGRSCTRLRLDRDPLRQTGDAPEPWRTSITRCRQTVQVAAVRPVPLRKRDAAAPPCRFSSNQQQLWPQPQLLPQLQPQLLPQQYCRCRSSEQMTMRMIQRQELSFPLLQHILRHLALRYSDRLSYAACHRKPGLDRTKIRKSDYFRLPCTADRESMEDSHG